MTAEVLERVNGQVRLAEIKDEFVKWASIPLGEIVLNKFHSQVIVHASKGMVHIVPVKQREVTIMDILVEDPKIGVDGLIIEETLRIFHHTLLDYMSGLRGRFRQVRETVIYSGYSRYSGRFGYALSPYTPQFYVKIPHSDLVTDRIIEIPHFEQNRIAFSSAKCDYTRY